MIAQNDIKLKNKNGLIPLVPFDEVIPFLSENRKNAILLDAFCEVRLQGNQNLVRQYPLLANLTENDAKRQVLPLVVMVYGDKAEAFFQKYQDAEIESPSKSKEILVHLSLFVDGSEFILPVIFKLTPSAFKEEYFSLLLTEIQWKEKPSVKTVLQAAVYLSRFPFLQMPEETSLSTELSNPDAVIESLSYAQRRNLFNGIVMGRRPSAAFWTLHRLKLLSIFLPEITAGEGISQNRFHAYDIMEHSIRACDGAFEPDLEVRWAALLHDIGKVPTRRVKENGEASFHAHELFSANMAIGIFKRLGIPKEIGKNIQFLVRNHMFHYTDEWTDKAIRRFMRKVSFADLEKLMALRMADRRGSGKRNSFPPALQKLMDHIEQVRAEMAKPKVTDLAVNGHDLKAIGIPPSKLMGNILQKLLEDYVNGHIQNDKEALLERAKLYFTEYQKQNSDSSDANGKEQPATNSK